MMKVFLLFGKIGFVVIRDLFCFHSRFVFWLDWIIQRKHFDFHLTMDLKKIFSRKNVIFALVCGNDKIEGKIRTRGCGRVLIDYDNICSEVDGGKRIIY